MLSLQLLWPPVEGVRHPAVQQMRHLRAQHRLVTAAGDLQPIPVRGTRLPLVPARMAQLLVLAAL